MSKRKLTEIELEDWLDEIDEVEEEQEEDGDWADDLDDDDLGDDDDGPDDDGEAADEDGGPLVLGDDDDEPEAEPRARRPRAEQRIQQLTGKARAAEQEAIAERKRRQELERRVLELEKQRLQQEESGLESEEQAARGALKRAYEDDDTDKITEAQARLTELHVRKARLKEQPPAAEAPPADEGPALAAEAQAWIERNRGWFNQPGHEKRSRMAARLSEELADEGLTVDDPRHYQELDRRMKQRIEQQRGRGRRPNAAAVPRGGDDGEGRGLRDQAGYKQFLRMTGERDNKRMRDAWQRRNELVD